MAAGNTYTPIATNTLANNSSNIVSFTSIPQSYTDLRLVVSALNYNTGSSNGTIRMNPNNVNLSTFTRTYLQSTGQAVSTATLINQTTAKLTTLDFTYWASCIVDIFSYTSTTINKSYIASMSINRGTPGTAYISVGTMPTTAAITQLDVDVDANNFASGSTFTLYGILKA